MVDLEKRTLFLRFIVVHGMARIFLCVLFFFRCLLSLRPEDLHVSFAFIQRGSKPPGEKASSNAERCCKIFTSQSIEEKESLDVMTTEDTTSKAE